MFCHGNLTYALFFMYSFIYVAEIFYWSCALFMYMCNLNKESFPSLNGISHVMPLIMYEGKI